jgi:hypothetical protein
MVKMMILGIAGRQKPITDSLLREAYQVDSLMERDEEHTKQVPSPINVCTVKSYIKLLIK